MAVSPCECGAKREFKRETIHHGTDDEYKEFKTGRRYTWAADRVM